MHMQHDMQSDTSQEGTDGLVTGMGVRELYRGWAR